MSHLTNQNRAYLLMRGSQNNQFHLQAGSYRSATILQVPVMYDFDYDAHCHCHCNHGCDSSGSKSSDSSSTSTSTSTSVDSREYILDALKNSVVDISESIKDIIELTTKDRGNSVLNNSLPTVTSEQNEKNKKELEALKLEISELKELIKAGGVSTEAVPEKDTSVTEVNKDKVLDNEGFINKWKSVNVDYKAPCERYKKAVLNGNTSFIADYKSDLNKLSKNADEGIAEIEKFLKGEGVSSEAKKVGEAAKKTLQEVKTAVAEALKTEAPKQAEKIEDTKETSSSKYSTSYSNISDAKKAAKEANAVYVQTNYTDPEKQRLAIIGYNDWGKTVLDEAKNKNLTTSEYLSEINECIKCLDYVCKYNKSSYVASAVSVSKELLSDLENLQQIKLKEENDAYLRNLV